MVVVSLLSRVGITRLKTILCIIVHYNKTKISPSSYWINLDNQFVKYPKLIYNIYSCSFNRTKSGLPRILCSLKLCKEFKNPFLIWIYFNNLNQQKHLVSVVNQVKSKAQVNVKLDVHVLVQAKIYIIWADSQTERILSQELWILTQTKKQLKTITH